jgi:hypothetical protein
MVSHYRQARPLGLQEVQAEARQSAHEGGTIVSPMHWPPLLPGDIPGTHICLEAESTGGP